MAEFVGKLGALYYSTATLRDTTISFGGTANTILDSGGRFITSGFVAADKIITTGADDGANNDLWTIAAGGVAAGVLTLDELTVNDESAGAMITIVTAPDDAQLLGFSNWSLDNSVDIVDVTKFEDGPAGYKRHFPILKDWTATADRFWLTTVTGQYDAFLGTEKWIRFFIKWVETPSGGTPAYYYEGMCEVSGISINEPVNEVVKQTLTFQGDGPLTLVTRTTAWDT